MKHKKPRGLLTKVVITMVQLLFKLVMLLVFGYPDLKSYSKRSVPQQATDFEGSR